MSKTPPPIEMLPVPEAATDHLALIAWAKREMYRSFYPDLHPVLYPADAAQPEASSVAT